MTGDPLTARPARVIAAQVARGEVTIAEVIGAHLDRVAARNPELNAIVTLNPRLESEVAEAQARLDRGAPARPLEGVPLVVKDNLPTAGLRTTYGSLSMAEHIPQEDAASVQRLKAAGALLIGKTNTSEFATSPDTNNLLFGPTRNPANPAYSPGGSSGGTGAAVGAGMAPIGLGTDFGGSVRIPSAWCGICGLRPTPGRVPLVPAEFAWDTLTSHVQGPMARDPRDLALMMSVLAGPHPFDPISLPAPEAGFWDLPATPPRLRIGLCFFEGLLPLDPEIAAVVAAAADHLAACGHRVERVRPDLSEIRKAIPGTRAFAIAARFGHLRDAPEGSVSDQLRAQIETASATTLPMVAEAERARSAWWRVLTEAMQGYDILLAPTMGGHPFRLGAPFPTELPGQPLENYWDILLGCYAISLLGLPAASVPCGRSATGLPIGLQIIGHRMREDRVLSLAAEYLESR
ncbi:amidase [Salipiger sp. P9]|uniref:amidase n=1 Tax=Salipiger pentaromativorans TaxID=2943193 RepID=UPI0021580936|nr:amidase [Salipiger pentaromativorans]MCR8547395.1 amidase [Salipiger pentaromativorans]